MSSRKTFLRLAFLAGLQAVQAGIDLGSSQNVAVYWGQNSLGQSTGPNVQQRLSYYCQNSDIDVFQLSFVTRINGSGGVPEVNFANAGDNCTKFDGTQLLNCPEIGADIKECQKAGKTILLSIGGATYNEGGFSSESAAVAGAELIWNTFGPVPSNKSVKRPFGDAVVDGFDFDFEAVVNNMPAFGNKIRDYYAADTSKKYYLTAAPQCVYPDAADNAMLDGAVFFDAIWVQFYNNWCGVQNFVPNSNTQNAFNFATWDNWAHNTSKNKNVKVYIGVPANTGAAGSGYVPVSTLQSIINYVKQFSSFGGIMMWDASQAYANNGFISGVAGALGSSSPGNPPTNTTTSVKPTTLTTTTLSTTTSPTTTSSTKTSSTTTSSGPTATGQVPQWGQCGSTGYNGPTACIPPYKCVKQGDWWSSCK